MTQQQGDFKPGQVDGSHTRDLTPLQQSIRSLQTLTSRTKDADDNFNSMLGNITARLPQQKDREPFSMAASALREAAKTVMSTEAKDSTKMDQAEAQYNKCAAEMTKMCKMVLTTEDTYSSIVEQIGADALDSKLDSATIQAQKAFAAQLISDLEHCRQGANRTTHIATLKPKRGNPLPKFTKSLRQKALEKLNATPNKPSWTGTGHVHMSFSNFMVSFDDIKPSFDMAGVSKQNLRDAVNRYNQENGSQLTLQLGETDNNGEYTFNITGFPANDKDGAHFNKFCKTLEAVKTQSASAKEQKGNTPLEEDHAHNNNPSLST